MTIETLGSGAYSRSQLQRDLYTGIMVGMLAIPICVAAGVLTASPLGSETAAEGATAGLYGGIVAGIIAAAVGSSSFVVSCPRASPSIVLASLIGSLLAFPQMAARPGLILIAAAACVLLAGVWQILFALLRISALLKFTPHPVFAGFMNGAALLILKTQIAALVSDNRADIVGSFKFEEGIFVAVVAAIAIFYPGIASAAKLPAHFAKIPGSIVAFVSGGLLYHLLRHAVPTVSIGSTLGEPANDIAGLAFYRWNTADFFALLDITPQLLMSSIVVATVATLESFMAFRASQNAADLRPSSVRDLAAQGCANCVSSMFSFVANAATPSLSLAAYRAGARTRIVGISSGVTILLLGVIFSKLITQLPRGVVSGVLIALAIMMFDTWSLRSLRDIVLKSHSFGTRRLAFDLAVVGAVMMATIFGSVVIGVGVGCLFSMVVFVIDMSKPIIRRTLWGNELLSKRMRSNAEISFLQKSGRRRVVLQLEGVLFFGNADDLSVQVKDLLDTTDSIVFDFQKVTDIDVSGANTLVLLAKKAQRQQKRLVLCNVSAGLTPTISACFDSEQQRIESLKLDLDSALEYIEECAIRERRPVELEIAVAEVDLLAGVPVEDIEKLRTYLTYRRFDKHDVVCEQGDPGDRMWLLVLGSVSVQVRSGEGYRRITSLGRGTMVGEMALIEGAARSARIVADSEVAAFELNGHAFERLLVDEPRIAERFMRNCARELSRRLRRTSEDLRRSLE